MTIWIVGCVLDGVLGAAILGCLLTDYWRARKKKPGQEAIYKEGKMLAVPFGERALCFLEWAGSPLQKRNKTKKEGISNVSNNKKRIKKLFIISNRIYIYWIILTNV